MTRWSKAFAIARQDSCRRSGNVIDPRGGSSGEVIFFECSWYKMVHSAFNQECTRSSVAVFLCSGIQLRIDLVKSRKDSRSVPPSNLSSRGMGCM